MEYLGRRYFNNLYLISLESKQFNQLLEHQLNWVCVHCTITTFLFINNSDNQKTMKYEDDIIAILLVFDVVKKANSFIRHRLNH